MDAPEYRARRDPLVPPGTIDAHPRDMTATFAADVTLRRAQSHLLATNQWLPIDGHPDATLGSLVDANSTGPLRLGYGAWRDLLLGVQFTNGRGDLISAGGRTVKNVAGYDLTKFMVGQRGTFGNLVTLTTRTYRRPDGAILAELPPNPAPFAGLLTMPLRPQWALLTPAALWCGYLGDGAHLDYYLSQLPRIEPIKITGRSVDDDIDHRAGLWHINADRTFRASVPPARIADFVTHAKIQRWAADPAFGIVVGAADAESSVSELRKAAQSVDGRITFNGASTGQPSDDAENADISTNAGERQIIERLKRAFDPDGRLRPLPWQNR